MGQSPLNHGEKHLRMHGKMIYKVGFIIFVFYPYGLGGLWVVTFIVDLFEYK
jgi:hypothetical protein